MFDEIGMQAFGERARRGLRATGETARRRPAAAGIDELTAHEAQIARSARDGLTNREIGAQLFLSSRTVRYHLGNVFARLGISSRSQLDRVLPASAPPYPKLRSCPGGDLHLAKAIRVLQTRETGR